MIATACNAAASQYHAASHCGSLPFTGGHDITIAMIGMAILLLGVIVATQVWGRRG